MEKDIFYYKAYCHELIENISSRGFSKWAIYRRLSLMLHVPEKEAHIGQMSTMSQVKRASFMLQKMNNKTRWLVKSVPKPVRVKVISNRERKRIENDKARGLMAVPKKGVLAPNVYELQKMANTLN